MVDKGLSGGMGRRASSVYIMVYPNIETMVHICVNRPFFMRDKVLHHTVTSHPIRDY